VVVVVSVCDDVGAWFGGGCVVAVRVVRVPRGRAGLSCGTVVPLARIVPDSTRKRSTRRTGRQALLRTRQLVVVVEDRLRCVGIWFCYCSLVAVGVVDVGRGGARLRRRAVELLARIVPHSARKRAGRRPGGQPVLRTRQLVGVVEDRLRRVPIRIRNGDLIAA